MSLYSLSQFFDFTNPPPLLRFIPAPLELAKMPPLESLAAVSDLMDLSDEYKHVNDACIQIISNYSKDTITLYDGSTWKVQMDNKTHLRSWKNCKIAIIQTDQNNSYDISKVGSDLTLRASLLNNPYERSFYFTLFEKKISAVDSAFRVVEMQNNSIGINYLDPLLERPKPMKFRVMNESRTEMSTWNLGETIMLGLQIHPQHPQYQENRMILINCTLKSHLKVIGTLNV